MKIHSNPKWKRDCEHWRGRVLTGHFAHWCYGWDDLPIDETTPEWPCECAEELIRQHNHSVELGEKPCVSVGLVPPPTATSSKMQRKGE